MVAELVSLCAANIFQEGLDPCHASQPGLPYQKSVGPVGSTLDQNLRTLLLASMASSVSTSGRILEFRGDVGKYLDWRRSDEIYHNGQRDERRDFTAPRVLAALRGEA